MNSHTRNKSGFTLLEVLISIVILTFISLGIYQAMTETFKLRDVLSNEGDFFNSIRLSMSILQRDVELLYSSFLILPQDTQPAAPADAKDMEAILSSDMGRSTRFWGTALNKTGIRPMHFIGTENKLSFVSASHIRVYKNSPESEFAKVSYELKEDHSSEAIPETKALVKTESPNAFNEDDDRDKYKHVYYLLHGVKRLRFRYYRKDKETYLNSWDSDSADLKNIYPDFIEVTLEVNGPERLHFEGLYKFRPEMPLRGLNPST